MSGRRPAAFTQAEIARVCRGAMQEGLGIVQVELPSGVKFSIPLTKESAKEGFKQPRPDVSEEEWTL